MSFLSLLFYHDPQALSQLNQHYEDVLFPRIQQIIEEEQPVTLTFDLFSILKNIIISQGPVYKIYILLLWCYVDPEYTSMILEGEDDLKKQLFTQELHYALNQWLKGHDLWYLSFPTEEQRFSKIPKNNMNILLIYQYLQDYFLLL